MQLFKIIVSISPVLARKKYIELLPDPFRSDPSDDPALKYTTTYCPPPLYSSIAMGQGYNIEGLTVERCESSYFKTPSNPSGAHDVAATQAHKTICDMKCLDPMHDPSFATPTFGAHQRVTKVKCNCNSGGVAGMCHWQSWGQNLLVGRNVVCRNTVFALNQIFDSADQRSVEKYAQRFYKRYSSIYKNFSEFNKDKYEISFSSFNNGEEESVSETVISYVDEETGFNRYPVGIDSRVKIGCKNHENRWFFTVKPICKGGDNIRRNKRKTRAKNRCSWKIVKVWPNGLEHEVPYTNSAEFGVRGTLKRAVLVLMRGQDERWTC